MQEGAQSTPSVTVSDQSNDRPKWPVSDRVEKEVDREIGSYAERAR